MEMEYRAPALHRLRRCRIVVAKVHVGETTSGTPAGTCWRSPRVRRTNMRVVMPIALSLACWSSTALAETEADVDAEHLEQRGAYAGCLATRAKAIDAALAIDDVV